MADQPSQEPDMRIHAIEYQKSSIDNGAPEAHWERFQRAVKKTFATPKSEMDTKLAEQKKRKTKRAKSAA